jgi:isoleucyl-tRNA synthetase
MFKSLPEKLDYPQLEKEILAFWKEHGIFEKSVTKREGKKSFTFFEGPPTVNGKPGIHHVLSRTLKDLICRYKTMRGYQVHRKAGWDTHGLPVEIALEKELGFKQKSDIEAYGVAAFNKKAKDLVYHHINMQEGWRTLTERTAYWVNMDDAYITCSNNYIESIWWALKEFYNKNLIYKGYKIVPQCPHCETPLSSHELALGYKDVKDPSVFVKCKITKPALGLIDVPNINDAKLLVWTTTPWTLISNVALAINPSIHYAAVQYEGETLICAEARLSIFGDKQITVLKTFTGEKLVGTQYEPLFDFVDPALVGAKEYPNAFTVVPGQFVTTDDGSGIVHMAPAFGQDDYEMSQKYQLPVLQPVTKGGRFIGLKNDRLNLNGKLVKTLMFADKEEKGMDREIVEDLKARSMLFNPTNKTVGELLKQHEHSYPHCWRCDNPLIYYARDSWFIRTTAYADKMIELNKTINWHPPEVGTGRFGNWLEENKDWSLSRDRYWGTPLPVWICENCSTQKCVGSIEELKTGWHGTQTLAESNVEIDLHKPFVDEVTFTCVKCSSTMRRTPELIDVWFDSGSMPFAQWHYPFENKEIFESRFPADYICEGIDQTRGWFYTLHAIATGVFGKAAFKNIIVNELILDKAGLKMSKSKGNVVDPFYIIDKYGADAARWYLITNSPPWRSTSFSEDDIRDIQSNFFRALTNTYAFLALYANIDSFEYKSDDRIAPEQRLEIDRWILSRLNTLVTSYNDAMDNYDPTRATRLVAEFTIEELSNWYVRRNRRRFWKGENDADKLAAYQTLFECLAVVCQLTAPFSPFIADYLYQNLRGEGWNESVHLTMIPESGEFAETNASLEDQMQKAIMIVSLVRSLREKSKIKIRQPLKRVLIPVGKNYSMSAEIEASIREEINVKEIEYIDEDNDIVKKKARPNFKSLGKRAGKHMQQLAARIKEMTSDEIRSFEQFGAFDVDVNGERFSLLPEDIEVQSESMEGWLVASDKGVTVALDTQLDEALKQEGDAREFVSHVQKLRKELGFEVTDRITIFARSSANLEGALKSCEDYIRQETLAQSVQYEDHEQAIPIDVNDYSCRVYLSKI